MDKKRELIKSVLLLSIIVFGSEILLLSCKQPVDSFKRDNIHDPVNANYKPGTASGLSISYNDSGIITISWADTAHYEDGFIIEKSLNDTTNFKEIGSVKTSVTSFQDSSKNVRKNTYYRVSAFMKQDGVVRKFASSIKKMNSLADITSFSNHFDRNSKTLQLTWKVNSPFATGYRLEYRKYPERNYKLIKVFAPGIDHYTDNLSDISFANRQYRLSVLLSGKNYDDVIARKSITFDSTSFNPTNLTIDIPNEQTVNLRWKDNSFFEKGFRVYRSTSQNAGTFKLIKTLPPNATNYQDQLNLRNNLTYIYRVQAYTDSTESGYVDQKITYNIPTPTLINDRYSNTQSNAISLSWHISNDQLVNKYILERKTVSSSNWKEVGSFDKNTTNYTDTGIDSAYGYDYRVHTISSDYSNELELHYETLFNKIATFTGHTESISDLVFSPDDHYLASSSSNGVFLGDSFINIWDLNSKKLFEKINSGSKPITSVDISNDGSKLATGSWVDGTVNVFAFPSGTLLKTFSNLGADAYDVKFSPDSKFIAATGGYGDVRKWNLKTGNLIFHYSGHGSPTYTPHTLAFKPDGSQIAVDDVVLVYVKSIVFINATTGAVIKELGTGYDNAHAHYGNDLNFNKDGSELAYNLGSLVIFNTNNWEKIYPASSVGLPLAYPSYDPGNNNVIAGSYYANGDVIQFFNTKTQKVVNKLTVSGRISYFTFSRDGSMIAVGLNNGAIEIWMKSAQKVWKVIQ